MADAVLNELRAIRALLERIAVESHATLVLATNAGKPDPTFWAELVSAGRRAIISAPLLKSELEWAALEKTIERRERMVEHWCEPGSLQRMLRAISNDLNARDRQAFDRRTTEGDADKRPRRRKPSKTAAAA